MSSDTSTLAVPSDPNHRRSWIIYQLKICGSSLARIAEELGVSRQATSDALTRPSERIEQAIADKLDLAPRELFPERFDQHGNRRNKRRRRANGGAQ